MVVFGALKFLILKVLSKEELNGNQILRVINEKTGWKVSCGSMYPALKDLTKKGFIESKKDKLIGKYKITKAGEQFLKEANQKKEEILKKIFESMSLLKILDDNEEISKDLEKHLKEGQMNDFFLCKELVELKKEIDKVNKNKNHLAIQKILNNAKEKIRRLR